MISRNIIITILITFISIVLCTLGFKTNTAPVESIAVIWPGAILHSVGAILFGGWGVLASVLNGIIIDIITVGDFHITVGFILPDFIQSFIPCVYYRMLLASKNGNDRFFNFISFLIFAALIPNTIGAFFGALVLKQSVASHLPFWIPFVRWLIANIPITLLLGYPLFRCLGPTLMEEGFVVKGWWK